MQEKGAKLSVLIQLGCRLSHTHLVCSSLCDLPQIRNVDSPSQSSFIGSIKDGVERNFGENLVDSHLMWVENHCEEGLSANRIKQTETKVSSGCSTGVLVLVWTSRFGLLFPSIHHRLVPHERNVTPPSIHHTPEAEVVPKHVRHVTTTVSSSDLSFLERQKIQIQKLVNAMRPTRTPTSSIGCISTITWIWALLVVPLVPIPIQSFLLIPQAIHRGSQFANIVAMSDAATPHPFCSLPGDPSLILTTNVSLGDKKLAIMKAISKAITQHTGKPETYVGAYVCC